MANVFTRKHHKPRTTTLRDFSVSYANSLSTPAAPRRPRIWSPTRRCNPHPTGLCTQQAYNKDHLPFDIWKPNFTKIAARMPPMISHLELVNFVSGSVLPPLNAKPSLPEIKYTIDTTSRRNFVTPTFPEEVKHEMKTTRFGYSPYSPAQGIVPAILPAIRTVEQEQAYMLQSNNCNNNTNIDNGKNVVENETISLLKY